MSKRIGLFTLILVVGCISLLLILKRCGMLPGEEASASATLKLEFDEDFDIRNIAPLPIPPQMSFEATALESQFVLRDLLASPNVHATSWYIAFQGDSASAALVLKEMLVVTLDVENTSLKLTVYAEDGEEALVILEAWVASYLAEFERRLAIRNVPLHQGYRRDLDKIEEKIGRLTHNIQEIERERLERDDTSFGQGLYPDLLRALQKAESDRDFIRSSQADLRDYLAWERDYVHLEALPAINQP